MRASSSGRPASCSPFQMMVPSKSMSMVMICGCTSLGGGLPTGMLSFTAWVWIGMVMISMMSSTSITSISGVVLMSTITSASFCPWPTVIAMASPLSTARRAARRRLGDEADLQYPGALAVVDHAPDELVAPFAIAADMHLGLRILHRDLLQAREELRLVDELVVPEEIAVAVDRDDDVLRLGLRRQVALLGQLERDVLDHHRDGDEEDDQQHQHHVDERRGVDLRVQIIVFRLPYLHCHVRPPCGAYVRRRAASSARRCRSAAHAPWPRGCGVRASCSRAPPAPPPQDRVPS